MEDRNITTQGMLRHVISRLGLREMAELPIYDIMVWMGEAIQQAGSAKAIETKRIPINVVNFIGTFPQDYYAIRRIVEYPIFNTLRDGFRVPLETGIVTLEYDAFPVDGDGFPIFENNVSTIEAVTWYVAKMLAMRGELPSNMPFRDCDSYWQRYCGQARANGFTPSMDQWNRMVNTFYRLIPDKQQYINDFKGLNYPEDLTLDKLNTSQLGMNYHSSRY